MPNAGARRRKQTKAERGYLARQAEGTSHEGQKPVIALDRERFPVGLTDQQKEIIDLIRDGRLLGQIALRMNRPVSDVRDEIAVLIGQWEVVRCVDGEGDKTRYETTYE